MRHLEATALSYNAVVSASGRDPNTAWMQCLGMLSEFADRELQWTTASVNSAITGCGRLQGWQQALHLLQEVQNRSFLTNTITAGAAISACDSSAQWQVALLFAKALQESTLQHGPHGIQCSRQCICDKWEVAVVPGAAVSTETVEFSAHRYCTQCGDQCL